MKNQNLNMGKDIANVLATGVRTLMVAKIDLDFLTLEERMFGLVPNIYDCFLMSSLGSDKLLTEFIVPNSHATLAGQVVQVSPIAGCKIIGGARDKGSVTAIMDKFLPFVDYVFENEIETDRFANFLLSIGTESEIVAPNTLRFPLDIIAHTSTDRDNVGALFINHYFDFKSIVEDKDIELSAEEILNVDILEIAQEREWSHRVFLKNIETDEIVYELGHHPIIIEDFFYQPQHSNRWHIKPKPVSMNYHQARDAMSVLTPTLYDVMVDTVNHNSIKEDMMCLGLQITDKEVNVESFRAKNTPEAVDDDELL